MQFFHLKLVIVSFVSDIEKSISNYFKRKRKLYFVKYTLIKNYMQHSQSFQIWKQNKYLH